MGCEKYFQVSRVGPIIRSNGSCWLWRGKHAGAEKMLYYAWLIGSLAWTLAFPCAHVLLRAEMRWQLCPKLIWQYMEASSWFLAFDVPQQYVWFSGQLKVGVLLRRWFVFKLLSQNKLGYLWSSFEFVLDRLTWYYGWIFYLHFFGNQPTVPWKCLSEESEVID